MRQDVPVPTVRVAENGRVLAGPREHRTGWRQVFKGRSCVRSIAQGAERDADVLVPRVYSTVRAALGVRENDPLRAAVALTEPDRRIGEATVLVPRADPSVDAQPRARLVFRLLPRSGFVVGAQNARPAWLVSAAAVGRVRPVGGSAAICAPADDFRGGVSASDVQQRQSFIAQPQHLRTVSKAVEHCSDNFVRPVGPAMRARMHHFTVWPPAAINGEFSAVEANDKRCGKSEREHGHVFAAAAANGGEHYHAFRPQFEAICAA